MNKGTNKGQTYMGVQVLLAIIIVVLWCVKFIAKCVTGAKWDTLDWVLNILILVLWLIVAVNRTIVWVKERRNRQ